MLRSSSSSRALLAIVPVLMLSACGRPAAGGEGEGEGEGEGSIVAEGEGEGEGSIVAEGEGEGSGVAEGEGEGSVVAEGEGEGVPSTGGGIDTLRAATPGVVSQALTDVVVTYVRAANVGTGEDKAGFYVQQGQTGPAVFVLDAAPTVHVGDIVSLTATSTEIPEGRLRVKTFTGLATSGTTNVASLVQDFGTKADLLSAIDSYEAELGTSTVTVANATDRAGGGGFRKLNVTTTAITTEQTATPFLGLRMAPDVFAAAKFAVGCKVTVGPAPLGYAAFANNGGEEAQFTAWSLSDIASVSDCAASATATAASSTSVVVTLGRALRAGQTLSASQFTITDGTNPLAVSAATASADGLSITLTTDAQATTSYTLTFATGVVDVFGNTYAPAAAFTGFSAGTPSVIITEVFDSPTGVDAGAKFVELTNATGAPVDISGYTLRKYSNGSVSSQSINLANVTLAAGQVFVVAGNSMGFSATFPAVTADDFAGSVDGTGDDVYELFDGTNVVDVYGVIGERPTAGQSWSYENSVAKRQAFVTSGRATYNPTEWTVTAQTAGALTATPGTR